VFVDLYINVVDLSPSFIAQGDREGQDVAVNPGLIAVLCIFCIVMAVVVVVVIVKAVRSRRPHFERLDDVSMVSLKWFCINTNVSLLFSIFFWLWQPMLKV